MARFDVYRTPSSAELLLDCQADILSDLPTRVVVPLIPVGTIRKLYTRLNPVFVVEQAHVAMGTQMAAAVPVTDLKVRVTSLAHEQSAIMNALDMLITGY